VEKQVKNLVTKTLSGFKTLIWISLAVAVVGLVCMFGISYGFYRPVIGFAVMLLFEACALVLAILAVSRTRDVKTDNELFEIADESLVSRFNSTLGTLSFVAFYVILAAVLLSLPLVLVSSDYVNSVMTSYSYFRIFFFGIVLILALVYLKCKKPYLAWVTNGELPQKPNEPVSKTRRTMSILQLTLTVIAGILFVIAPYFDYSPQETAFLYNTVVLVGFVCLLASVIIFVVFLVRKKAERTNLLIPGIRNLLIIPSALIVTEMHRVGWVYKPGDVEGQRYESWYSEYFWYALALIIIVFIVFSIIEMFIQKRKM